VLTLAALVIASARPARSVDVKVRVATVMVALDTSRSMAAEDVAPDRISAAKAAASRFVRELPGHFRLGLVLFAGSAAIEESPTDDRSLVLDAIQRARLADGTAIGEATFKSLAASTAH